MRLEYADGHYTVIRVDSIESEYYLTEKNQISLDDEDCFFCIETVLLNPAAAEHLYKKIEKAIDKAREFPLSYPDCSYYYMEDETYRHTNVGNYVFVFRVKAETHTIEFLRFLYSARDFSELDMEG